MELIIDRSKWLRGEGSFSSCLLRKDDGKMCCLGFFAKQLGAEDKNIIGKSAPIECKVIPWPEWFFTETWDHSVDTQCLMEINDDEEIANDREHEIAKIFARHDIKVVFIGK